MFHAQDQSTQLTAEPMKTAYVRADTAAPPNVPAPNFPTMAAQRRPRAMSRPGPPAPASTKVAEDLSAVAPPSIPASARSQKSHYAPGGSPAEHQRGPPPQ